MKSTKKSIFIVSLVLLTYGFLALSCATTEYLEKGNVAFEEDMNQKKAMDAIVYVLSERGFNIQMINESFGLIESDWKQTSDMADNIGTTILVGTLTGSNTYYYTFLKLSFRVTDTGYTVTPLYKQENQKSNNLINSSTTSGNTSPVKTSAEAKLAMEIVDEINSMLKIKGSINWQEIKK